MSKMAELDAALTALSELSSAISETIQNVRELLGADPEPAQAPVPKTYTIEEVRAVLLKKRRDGFRDEVKALLAAHGAERLTDVDPTEYAAMIQETEGIGA